VRLYLIQLSVHLRTSYVYIREDFSGTFLLCCEWVKQRAERLAIAVDLDKEVLDWGREHNLPLAGPAADRITVICSDVCDRQLEVSLVDVTVAFNYATNLFTSRRALMEYFRIALDGLCEDGILFLDLYGGTASQIASKYRKNFSDFTYIFEQSGVDVVSHRAEMAIHFRFPDKSGIKQAFSYSWRVWTLPEIVDALEDAGFKAVKVWWAEVDKKGEDQYEYQETTSAQQVEMWNAYIVALK